MSKRKLTEKQRRFVEAYMGEAAGNATEAARLAGYRGNDATLAAVGAENLKKPLIREAIDSRVASSPLVATREERQQFYTRVMLGEEQDVRVTATGEEIRTYPSLKERMKAAELLGKTQGDFLTRVEVEHSGTIRAEGLPVGDPVLNELLAKHGIATDFDEGDDE